MTGASAIEDLDPVLARLEPELGPLRGTPVALEGGLTNRNIRVRLGDGDYVLRLCGENSEAVSIDRDTEVVAQRAAHAAGVAPAVVERLRAAELGDLGRDVLVTEYAPGRALEPADVREGEMLERIARALRAIHDGPALPTAFPVFAIAAEYSARGRAGGAELDAADEELALELSARIEAALHGPEQAPVPCHNDLLASNFLVDGDALRIIDWEYAGMANRYFDLGNLAVNNELGDSDELRLLRAYFGEEPGGRRIATLRLMRLMSDVREALWGVVQSTVSELDIDYRQYAAEHFARLRAAASDPRLQEWLRAAAA